MGLETFVGIAMILAAIAFAWWRDRGNYGSRWRDIVTNASATLVLAAVALWTLWIASLAIAAIGEGARWLFFALLAPFEALYRIR